MGKGNESNFLKKVISNVILRNVILMMILAVALVMLTLFALNVYTRHNHSSEVPELKGMQVQDAAAIVKSANLSYEVVDSIYQENGIPGAILEQIPQAKSKVKEGRTIYLTIQSINEPQIAIPDLENASLRQAQTSLRTLGFNNVNIEYVPSEYKDLVYSIQYRGAALVAGQKIPKSAIITIKVGDGNGSSAVSDSLTVSPDEFGIDNNF